MPTRRTSGTRRPTWFNLTQRHFRPTNEVELASKSATPAPSSTKLQWMITAAAGAVLAMTSTPAMAQKTWDRGAGTNFWTDAANWNVDGVPTSVDSVIFTDNGAGIVDLNATTQPVTGSLLGVTFNNPTTGYTIQNGAGLSTTSLTNASGAAVTNTISTKITTSSLTVSSGKLVLSNGTNVISGPVSISAGATLDLAGPSSQSIGAVTIAGGRLTVRGGVTVSANSLFDRVYLRAPAQTDLNPISNLFAITPTTTRTIAEAMTYSLSRAGGAGDDNGAYSTRTLGIAYQGGNQNNIETLTTGKLTISSGGDYTFGTRSDDGSVLYIDLNNDSVFDPASEMVVNNNNFQGYTNRVGNRNLAAGTYNIAIGFYQGGCCDNNGLEVRYSAGIIAEASFDSMTVMNPVAPIAGTSFSFDTITAANIASSNLSITGAGSVLDIQSPNGVVGNLTFNAATSLSIEGSVGAAVTVGSVTGAGVVGLDTSVATTAGALSGMTTLNKGGSNTLTLGSDSPGFAGQINIASGVLRAAASGALGTAAGITSVSNGAQLNLAADNIAEPVTISGTGPNNSGALASGGATRTFSGPVTLGANASVISSTQNQTLNLTGGVATAGFETRFGGAGNTTVSTTGITGTGSIRKVDGGTLLISAPSNYSGATNVEGGTLEFTQPLSATSAINVTGGTVNGRSAVNAAATLTVSAGTFNAIDPGSLNATNITRNNGLLRVTGNIGSTGSISVTDSGRLHFDAGNGNTASLTTTVNVTNGGTVRATSGIADLAAQNIVITPLNETVTANQLNAVAITNGSDTDPNSLANINTILSKAPNFTTTLANGFRNTLDFPQANGDNDFSGFFGTTLPDSFTTYFTGRFTAPVSGVYNFRRTDNDDTAAVAIDFNNNGSFVDPAYDVMASAGCCNNDVSVNVSLAAGQTIGVFYGARDTGGGSGIRGLFTEPAGGTYTSSTIIDPTVQTGRWSSVTSTGGGNLQVDSGAELRANTVTGATNLNLGGQLTLSAGAGKASNARNLFVMSADGEVNIGAGHTLTAQTLSGNPEAVLNKTGAGTLTVTGNATITLSGNQIVASEGTLDLSNTRFSAVAQTTQQGLQGALYVDQILDPRNNPSGVTDLLLSRPTTTRLLTSATGPNGGLDFRDDNNVATFFNNTQVGNGGSSNWTAAFYGSFTAQATGSYTFGIEQNDDDSAIFIDSNQNGFFDIADQVFQRGCCLQNPPNADFESGTVNLTAGQIYDIVIVNRDTGGGGNLGIKFMEPAGGTVTTLSVLAPGAVGQTTQFNYTSGGGDLRVSSGATLAVRGTNAPVTATVAGTLRYSAQASATNNTLSNLTVANGQTGTIETGTNQTLTLGVGTTVSLSGNLVKTGPGRLAVNVNTTGTGTITVNGGTLGGTGVLAGPLTVGVSGTVAPGNSVGTLGSGNFALAGAGASLGIELDPTNSGGLGITDVLNVTGTVNLAGGNLTLSLISNPATIGQGFVIITNDGADSILGTFGTANGSPISNNTIVLPGGFTFGINYAAADGNDVALTLLAVPEPGTVSVLMLGLGTILARRRRSARDDS